MDIFEVAEKLAFFRDGVRTYEIETMAQRIQTAVLCGILSENLILKEHEAARWLTKEELHSVEWLPADVTLIQQIEAMMQWIGLELTTSTEQEHWEKIGVIDYSPDAANSTIDGEILWKKLYYEQNIQAQNSVLY